jgi:hypothetical protein
LNYILTRTEYIEMLVNHTIEPLYIQDPNPSGPPKKSFKKPVKTAIVYSLCIELAVALIYQA